MGPLDVDNMGLLQSEIPVIKLGHLTPFFTCLRKGKRGKEPPPKETKRGPFNN